MSTKISITDAPYDFILDLHGSLFSLILRYYDDTPTVIRDLFDTVELELGRRNAIRQALYELPDDEEQS